MDAPGPTLLYLVKQVELMVRARLDDLVRPAGITTLQYTALTVLQTHPGLTAAQLARRSFVTAQSTSDLIGALLERDLIERHRDPADRRRLVLVLTPAGRDVLRRLHPHVAALEAEMTRGRLASDTHALRTGLEHARSSLQRDRRETVERPSLDRRTACGAPDPVLTFRAMTRWGTNPG